jgi:hypothetical protein
MTTITITAPELKAITKALSSDWGPHIEQAARHIGRAVATIWALCSLAADRWQQLVAWVEQHHLHGLARLGMGTDPAPEPVLIQRLAPAAPPSNIAPPRADIIHPMARAVLKVRNGMSQRQAASLCGVSRTSLQRALKA